MVSFFPLPFFFVKQLSSSWTTYSWGQGGGGGMRKPVSVLLCFLNSVGPRLFSYSFLISCIVSTASSFFVFFSLSFLLCCILTSQSLAIDNRVRHSSSFFPSSRFAKTKAKSLGPRFFQMLYDSVYSLLPTHMPLPSGHVCAQDSHGIRGEVSTIQPILLLVYFIPKHKTTELKKFVYLAIIALSSSYLI